MRPSKASDSSIEFRSLDATAAQCCLLLVVVVVRDGKAAESEVCLRIHELQRSDDATVKVSRCRWYAIGKRPGSANTPGRRRDAIRLASERD